MNDFLGMIKGEKVDHIPFWFMRQAGRYLPEYRKLRLESSGFLDMVYTPQTASEITLQPLRRFGMDAAIIFSDILVIPQALGRTVEFVEGQGPKLNPLVCGKDVALLDFRRFDDVLSPAYDAVSTTRDMMNREGFVDKSLIGFCGAPWTLACYMIEGGSSRDFLKTKLFAYTQEQDFQALIDILIEACAASLQKQIMAGAQVVQIFDSWAGVTDAHSFVKWVINPTRQIVDLVHSSHPHVPVIGFPRMAGSNYLRYVQDTGVDVISIDQSVDPRWAARALQPLSTVQGNLDPACLLAGGDALIRSVEKIMGDLKSANGRFIFNLGHGIHKDTPVENVEMLVKLIREQGVLR